MEYPITFEAANSLIENSFAVCVNDRELVRPTLDVDGEELVILIDEKDLYLVLTDKLCSVSQDNSFLFFKNRISGTETKITLLSETPRHMLLSNPGEYS
jgi:hypothetical protein